jgi:hypothetical protein
MAERARSHHAHNVHQSNYMCLNIKTIVLTLLCLIVSWITMGTQSAYVAHVNGFAFAAVAFMAIYNHGTMRKVMEEADSKIRKPTEMESPGFEQFKIFTTILFTLSGLSVAFSIACIETPDAQIALRTLLRVSNTVCFVVAVLFGFNVTTKT